MQIDTSEREYSSSDPAREEQQQRARSWTDQQREAHRLDSGTNSISTEQRAASRQMGAENDEGERMDLSPRDRSHGPSSGSARATMGNESINGNQQSLEVEPAPQHAISRRGGWHTLMVEAGGISAAVSDESMRKLKYCLEWLQVRLFVLWDASIVM
jgi:hypothetical protein